MTKKKYPDLLSRPKLRETMKNYEESRLQQQCVAWFRAQYPQYAMLLTHPINEGSGHSAADRKRQGIHKAEGAVAGVPDLLLFMSAVCDGITYFGLGIEMKTRKGSQSHEQKDFQKMFENAGYWYAIVRSLDEFRRIVNDWIANVDADRRRRIASAHVEIKQAAEQREKELFYKIVGKK